MSSAARPRRGIPARRAPARACHGPASKGTVVSRADIREYLLRNLHALSAVISCRGIPPYPIGTECPRTIGGFHLVPAVNFSRVTSEASEVRRLGCAAISCTSRHTAVQNPVIRSAIQSPPEVNRHEDDGMGEFRNPGGGSTHWHTPLLSACQSTEKPGDGSGASEAVLARARLNRPAVNGETRPIACATGRTPLSCDVDLDPARAELGALRYTHRQQAILESGRDALGLELAAQGKDSPVLRGLKIRVEGRHAGR